VQNFVSAAVGMTVLVALIRGFTGNSSKSLGSFWVDLVRGTLYIMLPLSFLFALALVSQGVVQTFHPYQTVTLVEPTTDANGQTVMTQEIALGPAASQIAIKQLGTNGGGFFNANSAHPLENPTPLSNFLELLAILLIPAALCYTFGEMVGDRRQGWAILSAMFIVFLVVLLLTWGSEQEGNPALAEVGVDQSASDLEPGGNMEGKEVRFGIVNSALWAVATTAASNGSVNSMHDSYTPLGGLGPMWLIQLGEVIFGGVKPKQDIETGDEKPWVLKDLRKTCATYYDEHMPESSIEILGHSVGGVTYRHYAHRDPLAFKAIISLPQTSAFNALVHGFNGECPCCRRKFRQA
jgi:K+-transporting ATPase ATPase A chain